jgi:hypothetical protein
MIRIRQWITAARVAGILVFGLVPGTGSLADTWRGTAPFCAGECKPGEVRKGVSDSGDGGYCITGHKVLCGNASQSCPVTSTQTDCYGVVMICDNGSNVPPKGDWHSCGKYACGVCFGFSIRSLGSTAYRPDVCLQGYVWREATKDDHVCVTPATRQAAASDNGQAAARRAPNGGAYGPDTCLQGFVWREATANDHVCVPPAVREQARNDNALAAQRRPAPSQDYGPDTCKQGFVWREAIRDDHVCVTPDVRSLAASDNAQAPARRAGGGAYGPDTCKQGFVWRGVVPSDHVCVTPDMRDRVAQDNALADQRIAKPKR